MKKILFICLAFVMALCFVSCGDDEEDDIVVDNNNYYVKYEAQGSSSHGFAYISMNVKVNTPDGIKEFKSETGKSTSFSQTFGPVKKGFKASISTEGCAYMKSQIYVSVNQEPFVLKAEGESSTDYVVE